MKRSVLWFVACVFSLSISHSAEAVLLNKSFSGETYLDTNLPGTTSALRPELAGLVLEDETQPFSIPLAGISGTVQNRVVRETGSGTLDFYWKVNVDRQSTGPGGIDAFRLIDFGYDWIEDADWRPDGLGGTAPFIGRVFSTTPYPTGAMNFLFTDPPVPPGDPASDKNGSYFFFLHTDATHYAKTARYDLLGGPGEILSDTYATFAPAVPEPTSLLTAAIGLLGIAGSCRRKLSAR